MIFSYRKRPAILGRNISGSFCFIQILLLGISAGGPAVGRLWGGDTETVRKVATVRVDPASGKLVRSVVVQPRVVAPRVVTEPSPAPASQLAADASVNEIIEDAAQRHGVDPLLVHSVIQVESGYNANAVSRAGAQGLMQLIPSTARQLGVKDAFSPKENIEAGVRYLKYLQDLFKNDLRLALAAYNAGPGAVEKYKWIPPFAETQNYVYQVGKRWGEARRKASTPPPASAAKALTAAKPRETKAVEAKPSQPVYPKIEQYVDAEGRLVLRTP